VSKKETLDVGEFTAHLRNVKLPMGLLVDDVRLAGSGLHLQHDPFVAKVVEPGQLEVFVSEASLADFLNVQAPAGLRNFQVEARDGKLFVLAVKTVIVDLKASAVCTLRIVDQSKLMVDIESVDVGGAGVKNLIQSQMDRLNPVLDVADFPVKAKLLSVGVERNGVILFGTVEP
jgi:hypothetical protein